MTSMKVASLIVALSLALATGAPAQPATLADAAGTVSPAAAPLATGTSDSAPGASNYLLLALGLFGMGLVSRRRRPD
jgi:MYXO-CTERM domain-containing protein